jgi:Undecaprenyl-phosphate galactose phosphotransferase WbaP
MSKSDLDILGATAIDLKAPVPPVGLGLLHFLSDAVVVAGVCAATAATFGPAAEEPLWRPVLAGGLLVPVVKALLGAYTIGRLDLAERARRGVLGALVSATVLLALALATGSFDAALAATLTTSLTGFVTTFAADFLIVHGLLGGVSQWHTPVVIVGAGARGVRVAEKLSRLPWLGLRPVCFFDDDESRWHTRVAGLPVVGPVSLLATSPALSGLAQTAVIADAMADPADPGSLLRTLPFRQVYVVVGDGDADGMDATCHNLHGLLTLRINRRAASSRHRLRRTLDIAGAAMALAAFGPLMLLIALAIRLDSPGPVLFRQERWAGGRGTFGCLKFRSMKIDAEAQLQRLLDSDERLRAEYTIHHKLSNDPRITRIGRLLRKTSLDELPQLWNVLKGEMSLVGPRAYMTRELAEVGAAAEVIGTVRPGITGYWQVSGRHRTTFQERVTMDVFYARNRGVLFDVHILVKTVFLLFKADGT